MRFEPLVISRIGPDSEFVTAFCVILVLVWVSDKVLDLIPGLGLGLTAKAVLPSIQARVVLYFLNRKANRAGYYFSRCAIAYVLRANNSFDTKASKVFLCGLLDR